MVVSGTLYTPAKYHKAYRCLLAAKFSGAKVTVADYVPGVTDQSPNLAGKFPPNECPLFVSSDGKQSFFEANAIAHYLGNAQLRGDKEEQMVMQWGSFTDSVILPSVGTWVYPTLGVKDINKNSIVKAKENVTKFMEYLNNYMSKVTYLVGEKITQADLTVFTALQLLFTTVFDENARKPYPHVVRWYTTIANQPEVIAVCGSPTVEGKASSNGCEKPAPAKKEKAKPAAKSAPKPAGEEPEEEEAPKKKENKLALLPPGKLNLEEWKRMFSNNDLDSVALPWLMENFEPENYSIWYCEYKYPDELNQLFQSKNLVRGFFQRMESATKYCFAGQNIYGKAKDSQISGVWLWRGTGLIFELSEDLQADYECYTWKKMDPKKPEDFKIMRDHWKCEGSYHNRECADGIIFK
ncbi:Elongation factor 1-gamma [Cichlidogyrus casuarinus]|uniref:Elongation factor 1-gamma n=1 Tax=Cichlidogyrus casuarinus TaxID=1844966 RepID=A0ABD2QJ29_9PLAT